MALHPGRVVEVTRAPALVDLWSGLVSRPERSSWRRGWRREIWMYPNMNFRPGRGHDLVDFGITATSCH